MKMRLPTSFRPARPPSSVLWALLAAVLAVPVAVAERPRHGAPGEVDGPALEVIQAVQRAERALALGEPEIAESAFRDAVREGWLLLGQLSMATAKSGGDNGAVEALGDAEHAFRRALEASVVLRQPLMLLAVVHLQRQETEDALVILRDLIARDPTDGAARRLLAQALVSSGETAAAVQELEEGWAADPTDLETGFALATGYLRLGKPDRAEKLFSRVAEARPLPETSVLVGRMYRDFGHFDQATSWLERALEQDAAVRRARYYLGTVVLLRQDMEGLEEAIELFEAELELVPEDPMTHLFLGSALVERREFERAIPLLEHAATWPPARFDAERYRGRALLGLGRLEESIEVLEAAFEISAGASPRDLAEMHYQLGTAKRSLGRMDEASEHFETSKRIGSELAAQHREVFASFVRDESGRPSAEDRGDSGVDPFDLGDGGLKRLGAAQRDDLHRAVSRLVARASMNLGVLDARAGRFERAAGHFERAAEAKPELEDLDRSLGMALFKAGRFEEAVEPLARALAKATSGAPGAGATELRRTLAVAHLNAGHFKSTVELLEDDPDLETTPALGFTYAVALVRGGRLAEAAPIFDRLSSEGDSWPGLHVVLGQAKAQEGDFEAAESSLRRALELDPGVAEARVSLGEVYLRQGRLEESIEVLHAEVERRPGNLEARYLLATTLDLHRRPEEAEDQLRLLLRAAPHHADARYLLGKILLASGDAPSAVEQLEAAADASPEDANIHYQLGQAYQRSGRPGEARRHFEIYSRLKAEQRESPS